jgi:hypothetical protein
MRKILLGGAAAVALSVVAFTGTAKAECFWNGYGWSCAPAPTYYTPYTYPYGYYPGYYYNNAAPPYDTPEWSTGYKPSWLPSYPGPRASSGGSH